MLKRAFAILGIATLVSIFAPSVPGLRMASVAVASAPSPTPTPTPATYLWSVSGSFVLPYSANRAEVSKGILAHLLNQLQVQGVPKYKVGPYTLATASPSPSPSPTPTPSPSPTPVHT
jgi:hypothetical protein